MQVAAPLAASRTHLGPYQVVGEPARGPAATFATRSRPVARASSAPAPARS